MDVHSAKEIVARERTGKGCWYFIFTFTCVGCGRVSEHRERVWDHPKPENSVDRRRDYYQECVMCQLGLDG